MGRFAVRAALQDPTWSEITVADVDGTAAELFVGSCQAASLHALQLDVTDAEALRVALERCDVVLNLVGPYFRFGPLVLAAAIETRTDYLDINDDWEPTLEMLKLDERARKREVTAVLGMGASPGLTNLLALRAAEELDQVEVLHTIWGIGEQGLRADRNDSALSDDGESDGAAIEHWVHQVSGSIVAVEEGALVEMSPLRAVEVDYPGIGPVVCRSVGHPEPITFMNSMAGLRCSLNLMDLPRALDCGGVAGGETRRSRRIVRQPGCRETRFGCSERPGAVAKSPGDRTPGRGRDGCTPSSRTGRLRRGPEWRQPNSGGGWPDANAARRHGRHHGNSCGNRCGAGRPPGSLGSWRSASGTRLCPRSLF